MNIEKEAEKKAAAAEENEEDGFGLEDGEEQVMDAEEEDAVAKANP